MGQLLSSVAQGALDTVSAPSASHVGQHQELRSLANKHFQEAHSLSQQSQAAYHRGEKALASTLSQQSKAARAKAESLNADAAAAVFVSHNPRYPGDYAEIDLHGLFVSEAVERVEEHLVQCRQRGVQRTRIITGRGLHSSGGVAKIKPEVMRLMQSQGIKVMESSQGGALEVELPTGEGMPKKSGFRALLRTILKALLGAKQ